MDNYVQKGGAKENENTKTKKTQKKPTREKRFGARGHLVQKLAEYKLWIIKDKR